MCKKGVTIEDVLNIVHGFCTYITGNNFKYKFPVYLWQSLTQTKSILSKVSFFLTQLVRAIIQTLVCSESIFVYSDMIISNWRGHSNFLIPNHQFANIHYYPKP